MMMTYLHRLVFFSSLQRVGFFLLVMAMGGYGAEETPEKRWQRAIKEGRSFLKLIPEKTPMDHHFALHYTRNVGGDGIFTFHGMEFLIEKGPRYKDVLLVLQPPYGSRQIYTRLSVLYNGSTLKEFILKGNKIIEEWNVI